jgi:aspartyl/asparaginyl-tRNA synthetase
MDLIYPEGYGEALSGGEREYQLAEKGLFPSAGFGIGIERQKQEEKRLKRLARHKNPLSGDEEPTPEGQEPKTP